MQTDMQPTRLGRLHAVMEMSTLDASLDGTRISGSFTQLVTHPSPHLLCITSFSPFVAASAMLLWAFCECALFSIAQEGCVLMQEVQRDGMDGTSQVLQWQMAMHRDEPCTTSGTSSGEGEPNVPVDPSPLLLANSAAAGHTQLLMGITAHDSTGTSMCQQVNL
jgi:hypothetical protein